MFDIGWPELLVIATILIVVVGPKDLPHMLRAFGRTMSKVRGMAAEFRTQFDDALREAELDEVRKAVSDVKGLDPRTSMREAMEPFRKAGDDVRKTMNETVGEEGRDDDRSPEVGLPEFDEAFDSPVDVPPDDVASGKPAAARPNDAGSENAPSGNADAGPQTALRREPAAGEQRT